MLKEGQTKASKYNISFSNSDSDSPLSRTLNKQINKFGGRMLGQPSPLVGNTSVARSGRGSITMPSKPPPNVNTYATPHTVTPLLTPGRRTTPRNTPGTGRNTTPRNSTSSAIATPAQPDTLIIAAIVQGRGHAKCEIGIASVDMKSPSVLLSQYTDTATYVRTLTKLNILNPVEILFPNTASEAGNQSELYKLVTEATSCPLTTVQRKYFNEGLGLQYAKHLSIDSLDDVQTKDKYYCLSAVGALMKYVEFIQNTVFAVHSVPIQFAGSDKTTLIDATTSRLLELVGNAQDSRSQDTLFGVLNRTKTSGGAKLLRSTILQPPSDLDTIALRHDCVDELLSNEEVFNNLESVLSRFVDVDTTISLLIQVPKQETLRTAENRILHIICLKHLLELVKPLGNAIKDTQNNLFKAMLKNLQDERFAQIKEKIDEIIHEDTYFQKGALNMRTQKCFAVKPHLNGLLDVARRTYTEMVDDVAETIKKLAQRYNLPLKTGFTSSRGFYIVITMKAVPDLPPVFVKVLKQKNGVTCTTGDLIKLNDRINESLNDIYLMTNEVTKGLLQQIYPMVGCLYKLSECSAMLDMLTSFASVCTLSDYIRPEFTDTLALKDSLHPILGKIESVEAVSNDVFASGASSFNIITGPNMSGKSTYIKQIALLQVMAQVGCFIPASYASLKLVDNIFSRIGCDDDIETNASTFTLEMREMKYILDNMSDKSLVVIDELGRGTGVEEGAALCFAISEHILTKVGALVFFVTHFQELEHLETIYPNVVNYHFQVNYELAHGSTCEKVQFLRKLSKGPGPNKEYGIKLAKLTALPAEITADAEKLSKELRKKCGYTASETSTEDTNEQNVFGLAEHLLYSVHSAAMPEKELLEYLRNLQQECMGGNTSGGNDESRDVTSNSEECMRGNNTSGENDESRDVTSNSEECMGGNTSGGNDESRDVTSNSEDVSFEGGPLSEETGVVAPGKLGMGDGTNRGLFTGSTDPVRAAASSRRNLSIFGAADKESFLEVGVNQKTDPVRAAASSRRNLSIFGAADKESVLEVGANQRTTGNDASFLALGRTRVVSRDNIPPFSVEYSTSRDSNKSSDGVTRSLGGELMTSQYDVIYSKSDLSGGERAGSSSEDARTSEGHFGVKFTTSDTGYDMQCSGTSSDRRSVFEIVNSKPRNR